VAIAVATAAGLAIGRIEVRGVRLEAAGVLLSSLALA
jgi:hypothetical protein